jgi:hypothetical protein
MAARARRPRVRSPRSPLPHAARMLRPSRTPRRRTVSRVALRSVRRRLARVFPRRLLRSTGHEPAHGSAIKGAVALTGASAVPAVLANAGTTPSGLPPQPTTLNPSLVLTGAPRVASRSSPCSLHREHRAAAAAKPQLRRAGSLAAPRPQSSHEPNPGKPQITLLPSPGRTPAMPGRNCRRTAAARPKCHIAKKIFFPRAFLQKGN